MVAAASGAVWGSTGAKTVADVYEISLFESGLKKEPLPQRRLSEIKRKKELLVFSLREFQRHPGVTRGAFAKCPNCEGVRGLVTVVMEEDMGSRPPVSFWHPCFETRQSEPPNPPEGQTDSNGPR